MGNKIGGFPKALNCIGIFIFLATACTTQENSTVAEPQENQTSTPNSATTYYPTSIATIGSHPVPSAYPAPPTVEMVYPAPAQSTVVPSLLPTPTIELITATATQTPICFYSFGGAMFGGVSGKKASQNGFCEIEVFVTIDQIVGYKLIYPEEWTVRSAGVSALNLIFNDGITSGTNQQVFLLFMVSDLPLDESDRAVDSYEMSSVPLVNPEEVIQSKTFEMIKDKRILKVITRLNVFRVVHYFFRNNYYLYMVEIKTPLSDLGSVKYRDLITTVENMIASVEFINLNRLLLPSGGNN